MFFSPSSSPLPFFLLRFYPFNISLFPNHYFLLTGCVRKWYVSLIWLALVCNLVRTVWFCALIKLHFGSSELWRSWFYSCRLVVDRSACLGLIIFLGRLGCGLYIEMIPGVYPKCRNRLRQKSKKATVDDTRACGRPSATTRSCDWRRLGHAQDTTVWWSGCGHVGHTGKTGLDVWATPACGIWARSCDPHGKITWVSGPI